MNKVPFIVQQNVSIMSIFDLDEIRYNTISEIKLFVVKFISEGSGRDFLYIKYIKHIYCTYAAQLWTKFFWASINCSDVAGPNSWRKYLRSVNGEESTDWFSFKDGASLLMFSLFPEKSLASFTCWWPCFLT